ncbi:Histone-lysine N-methyltransferase SUVR5 [Hordeum vulgare]|nr:Histone-lysine N-methyltransferase SUVR5 [Hordeum vulgare]
METGKHAMNFGEPLSSSMSEFPDTQDSKEVLDAPDKPFEHVAMVDRKRKRGNVMEEEISVFTSMTGAVKEVAIAMRESKSLDVHPHMYTTIMDQRWAQ